MVPDMLDVLSLSLKVLAKTLHKRVFLFTTTDNMFLPVLFVYNSL